MNARKIFLLVVVLLTGLSLARAVDLEGKWTTEFDSEIGIQKYTYEFTVEGIRLAGKAKFDHPMGKGEVTLKDIKASGDVVSFVEPLRFEGNEIIIIYRGRFVGDELHLTREVGEFATEELVLRRAKDPTVGTPLFNGRDLDGWQVVVGNKGVVATQDMFQVTDGTLHAYKDAADGSEQPFGYLLTAAEYDAFHLTLEYKWGVKKFAPRAEADTVRDAGVCYHVRGPFEIWPTSVECQIQEGDTGDVWAIHTQVTSTIHSDIMNYWPAERGGLEVTRGDDPRGYRRFLRSYCYERPGWNRVELIVEGDRATYLVNGRIANQVTKLKFWDETTKTWQPLTKGRILLQAEGAEIFYRNVTIQPLVPSPAAANN